MPTVTKLSLMEDKIITEGKYRYIEVGEGTPMIILHGLMGGLSNFSGVTDYFPSKGYKGIRSGTSYLQHANAEDKRKELC